jgi:FHS family L-fucose permease-like MFS transporter
MGKEETATRRLNLAQAFNPIGSLLGMFVASKYILASLQSDIRNEKGELIFSTLSQIEKMTIRTHDLAIIRNPYLILGGVVIVMFFLILIYKMPVWERTERKIQVKEPMRRLLRNKVYREGVIAQLFYVAAQIMCWTFIIQYAENLGIDKSTAQNYNIAAMVMFLTSRFISTFLMKYINPNKLLTLFAIGGMTTTAGTILIQGMPGLYCLVATSAFMSLMFPTIYGIALKGIGTDATLGSAGLVMAIVGGALMPPIQGSIIDLESVGGYPAVNLSFILPFVCFLIVAIYGYRSRILRAPA